MKISNKLLFLISFLLFFIPAFLTLKDYGISWDEPTHFKRGQGYLWYILTGNNNYQTLPKYNLLKAQNDNNYHQRSFFQDDIQDASFYRTIDGGHPTFNDLSASLSNLVFYQKLGILGDVESYHFFEIFVSSLGVGFLFLMVYESYGLIAAIFSEIFFATYPLFFAESHFNIKDPVETSFIIPIFYFLWKTVVTKKNRYIVYASLFAGAALGTKFNVLFLPLIVIPWFLSLKLSYPQTFSKFIRSKKFIILICFAPIIAFLIFFATYPFLWQNPFANLLKVFIYYKNIGIDSNPTIRNELIDWVLYPLKWVVFTTPPLILAGFLLGVLNLKKYWQNKYNIFLLWLFWVVVPILRVSIPGTTIYGGVRQIMEYIPPLSMIAGTSIYLLLFNTFLKQADASICIKAWKIFLAVVCLLVSLIPIIRLHPNENVYFNFLIGGLKGAIERNIPSAGNSFGNVYKQGADWINKNAPLGSKLTLLQGATVNLPHYQIRPDISFSATNWSAGQKNGEYIMELNFNYETKANFYAWEYVEKTLEPVYEVKVDNVPILKIWKNDLEHTKKKYQLNEVENTQIDFTVTEKTLTINLNTILVLSHLEISFSPDSSCQQIKEGFIETSEDSENWLLEKDYIPYLQLPNVLPQTKTQINYYFPARQARYIRIIPVVSNPCLFLRPQPIIFTLEKNGNSF